MARREIPTRRENENEPIVHSNESGASNPGFEPSGAEMGAAPGGDTVSNGGGTEGGGTEGEGEQVNPGNNGAATTGSTNKKGKTDEQKVGDFKRLAAGRASNAFDAMTALSHLANTTQYSWTEEQENAIFGALEDKVRLVRAGFKAAREAAANRVPGERGKRQRAYSVTV